MMRQFSQDPFFSLSRHWVRGHTGELPKWLLCRIGGKFVCADDERGKGGSSQHESGSPESIKLKLKKYRSYEKRKLSSLGTRYIGTVFVSEVYINSLISLFFFVRTPVPWRWESRCRRTPPRCALDEQEQEQSVHLVLHLAGRPLHLLT